MLQALAEAAAALARPDYLAAARRSADFLLNRLTTTAADGSLRLLRSFREDQARLQGYLEDYAAVALGLLALYEATFELPWLQAAAGITDVMLPLFWDQQGGGFFQATLEHEGLILRRKDFVDNAVPAGNSLAAELLLRLGHLLERPAYTARAESILAALADAMPAQPAGFGRLLCAAGFYLQPGFEIVIVGDPLAPATRSLLTQVWTRYLPTSVLAGAAPGDTPAAALVPLLADRGQVNGRPTAYVCQNYTCNLPVTDPGALAAQLEINPATS
jgi:uncharacterized protein YyaL (SSP411 family)